MLLRYIDGFKLVDLAGKAEKQRDAWQGVCQRAVDIVGLACDYGILNMDVKPSDLFVEAETDAISWIP